MSRRRLAEAERRQLGAAGNDYGGAPASVPVLHPRRYLHERFVPTGTEAGAPPTDLARFLRFASCLANRFWRAGLPQPPQRNFVFRSYYADLRQFTNPSQTFFASPKMSEQLSR